MQLIKLDATASTNNYLKVLAREKSLDDFTVVMTDAQTQGRGQKGNAWISERGKNLTVSVLKRFKSLGVHQGFALNCLVSLAIGKVLMELSIPNVTVKWPNDIMSGNKKLCGILIENTLQGQFITQSIIGFGLNVNQTFFADLPNATSLKIASGKDFDLQEVLDRIMGRLKNDLNFEGIGTVEYSNIFQAYESSLFRLNVLSNFTSGDGEGFKGTIKGIASDGRLVVEKENDKLRKFDFKEIQFVY